MTGLGLGKPQRAKKMSKIEVAALLFAARHDSYDRAFSLLALQYIFALRIGEVVALRWTDIKAVDKQGLIRSILVPTEKKTPPGEAKRAPMPIGKKRPPRPEAERPRVEVPTLAHFDWVREAFRPAIAPKVAMESPYLFPGRYADTHMSERTAHNIFVRARDRAELSMWYTSHALRHTAATELEFAIHDPSRVAWFLRHSRLSGGASRVTMAYIHYEPRNFMDAIAKKALMLPPLRPLVK